MSCFLSQPVFYLLRVYVTHILFSSPESEDCLCVCFLKSFSLCQNLNSLVAFREILLLAIILVSLFLSKFAECSSIPFPLHLDIQCCCLSFFRKRERSAHPSSLFAPSHPSALLFCLVYVFLHLVCCFSFSCPIIKTLFFLSKTERQTNIK